MRHHKRSDEDREIADRTRSKSHFRLTTPIGLGFPFEAVGGTRVVWGPRYAC